MIAYVFLALAAVALAFGLWILYDAWRIADACVDDHEEFNRDGDDAYEDRY